MAWRSFFLTGSDGEGFGPLGFILEGGRQIPNDDFGYGPPHAFTPAEVEEIDRALSQINTKELYDRTNPSELIPVLACNCTILRGDSVYLVDEPAV